MLNEYKVEKRGSRLKRKYAGSTYLPLDIDVTNYKKILKPCSVIVKKWDENRSPSYIQNDSCSYKKNELNERKVYESTLENYTNVDKCNRSKPELDSKTVENVSQEKNIDVKVLNTKSCLANSVESLSLDSPVVDTPELVTIPSNKFIHGGNEDDSLNKSRTKHTEPVFSEIEIKDNICGEIDSITKNISCCSYVRNDLDIYSDKNDYGKNETIHKGDLSYGNETKLPSYDKNKEPLRKENDVQLKKQKNLESNTYDLKTCSVVLSEGDHIDSMQKGRRSKSVHNKVSFEKSKAYQNYSYNKQRKSSISRAAAAAKQKYRKSKGVRKKPIVLKETSSTSSDDENCANPKRSQLKPSTSVMSFDDKDDTKSLSSNISDTESENNSCFEIPARPKFEDKKEDNFLNKFSLYIDKWLKNSKLRSSLGDTESNDGLYEQLCKYVKEEIESGNEEMSKISNSDSSESSEDDEESGVSNDDYKGDEAQSLDSEDYDDIENAESISAPTHVKKIIDQTVPYILCESRGTQTRAVNFAGGSQKVIGKKTIKTPSSLRMMPFNVIPNKSSNKKYVVHSQIGKKYIVDYFESDEIEKLFVTVHYQEKSNSQKPAQSEQDTKKAFTISDLLNAFKTFDKQNYEIISKNPYMQTLFSCLESENMSKLVLNEYFPKKENSSSLRFSNGKNKVIAKSEKVSNQCGKEFAVERKKKDMAQIKKLGSENKVIRSVPISDSELSPVSDSELVPENELIPEAENIVFDSAMNDSSSDSEKEVIISYSSIKPSRKTEYCVQCNQPFLSRMENFNHTCAGKRQKGFLCEYCEKVIPSYKKFKRHTKMHLNT